MQQTRHELARLHVVILLVRFVILEFIGDFVSLLNPIQLCRMQNMCVGK